MEPITLCGLVIVIFGLWVEFEPATRLVVKKLRKFVQNAKGVSPSSAQRPIYVGKLPICLAKAYHN